MPIYEYSCESCGARFDKLMRRVSSSQEVCPICPQCGSQETRRIPSAFAVTDSQITAAGSTETEPTPTPRAPATSKEDIDRWRKQSKNKK